MISPTSYMFSQTIEKEHSSITLYFVGRFCITQYQLSYIPKDSGNTIFDIVSVGGTYPFDVIHTTTDLPTCSEFELRIRSERDAAHSSDVVIDNVQTLCGIVY